jgi:presenilin-like A22 family membrane protease
MAGMVCLTVAFFLFSRWSEQLSQFEAMRDTLLAGMGMGLVVVPMLIAVQSTVSRADMGIATSVIQFFMSIGGAVGISVMGTVMAQRLHAGSPLVGALHGVFVVGLTVSVVALAAAFLVPRGSARDLARAEVRGEPTHAGG